MYIPLLILSILLLGCVIFVIWQTINKQSRIEHYIYENSQLTSKLEAAQLRYSELEKRNQDFDLAQEAAVQSAKAAIFEVGGQLSMKLMEEHKRENLAFKKEAEEKVKLTTEQLYGQFQNILNSVAALNSQVKDSSATVDLVKRALLSPTGAGSFAEITLENILKASGLIAGQDFIMQYSVPGHDGDRLRPDAVVFLPDDNVMVIDSKASKFFQELASSADDASAKYFNQKLKSTMRSHLKLLAAKDYKEAVRSHLTKLKTEIKYVSTIMFLPSDMAVEKLLTADQEFIQNAYQADIILCGPTGVMNILAHARFQIAQTNQEKNQQLILIEVRKLMGSIATIYEHARKLGSSVQNAAVYFDKFAASFNSNLLNKAKTLHKLGLSHKGDKNLPANLERYQVISANLHLIEAEVNDIEDVTLIDENIENDLPA